MHLTTLTIKVSIHMKILSKSMTLNWIVITEVISMHKMIALLPSSLLLRITTTVNTAMIKSAKISDLTPNHPTIAL